MSTTKAFRIALTAAALCAAGTFTTAAAKPRSLVVLDFDGPRALADNGRGAVVTMLGDQYDVISTKRWEEARAKVKEVRGPQGWRKASRDAGVDAVIEGWIQDEGRHKLLYVLVRDASTGDEVDKVSVKLGKSGVSSTTTEQLRTALEEVFEYVEGTPGVRSKLPPVSSREARELTGSKRRLDGDGEGEQTEDAPRSGKGGKGAKVTKVEDGEGREDGEDDEDGEERRVTERKPRVSAADLEAQQEKSDVIEVFGKDSVEAEDVLGKKVVHVPQPSPRFSITGGGYYGSRSFIPEADGDEVQDYAARSKGLQLQAAVYPFPVKKMDGGLSGVGFTVGLYHSAGSVVGADTDDTVGDYAINQHGFEGAVHYRQPLGGLFSIDGEVGYSQHNYVLASDFPLDVPDTKYSAFHAGAHVDLHVTQRATIGFGAKMFYVLDNGDMSSLDWYGPGSASGFNLGASFVIPLPARLHVRGDLSYQRFTTTLDGVGAITEDQTVLSTADATMNGSVNLGISF